MKLGQEDDGSDTIAHPLFPKEYWDLTVLIAITTEKKKKTGSTDGMESSRLTSPYYQSWIDSSVADIEEMLLAITDKDFQKATSAGKLTYTPTRYSRSETQADHRSKMSNTWFNSR